MTQPTQAQIEAALVAYNRIDPDRTLRGAITRALTAAAQVGEPAQKQFDEALELALVMQTKRDTIERCAQVAEQQYARIGGMGFDYGQEIAAAIRKIKDAQ